MYYSTFVCGKKLPHTIIDKNSGYAHFMRVGISTFFE